MSRLKKAYKQPRFRYSALAHCVAWANISIQVLFPLAVLSAGGGRNVGIWRQIAEKDHQFAGE